MIEEDAVRVLAFMAGGQRGWRGRLWCFFGIWSVVVSVGATACDGAAGAERVSREKEDFLTVLLVLSHLALHPRALVYPRCLGADVAHAGLGLFRGLFRFILVTIFPLRSIAVHWWLMLGVVCSRGTRTI